MWVADCGFASVVNRAYLAKGGGHYIHAEKLRGTNAEAAAAPARGVTTAWPTTCGSRRSGSRPGRGRTRRTVRRLLQPPNRPSATSRSVGGWWPTSKACRRLGRLAQAQAGRAEPPRFFAFTIQADTTS